MSRAVRKIDPGSSKPPALRSAPGRTHRARPASGGGPMSIDERIPATGSRTRSKTSAPRLQAGRHGVEGPLSQKTRARHRASGSSRSSLRDRRLEDRSWPSSVFRRRQTGSQVAKEREDGRGCGTDPDRCEVLRRDRRPSRDRPRTPIRNAGNRETRRRRIEKNTGSGPFDEASRARTVAPAARAGARGHQRST